MTNTPRSPLDIIDGYPDYTASDVPEVVQRWLCATFVKARHARLGQAGHGSQARITLAQVFTDIESISSIPPSTRMEDMAMGVMAGEKDDGEEESEGLAQGGFVAYMLRRRPVPIALRARRRCHRHHHLVIGGPGQGKSTTGQYLAQMHRAALLRSRHAQLDEQERETFDEVATTVAAGEFSWPAVPCVPARMALGELAAWMVNRSVVPGSLLPGARVA